MTENRKKIGVLILGLLTGILIIALARFIHHRIKYAVTNAVFVETNRLVYLAFEDVAGRIKKLKVQEGEKVYPRQILALLDNKAYKTQKRQLIAQLQALKNQKDSKIFLLKRVEKNIKINIALAQEDIARLQTQIKALEAEIKACSADIDQLQKDQKRFQNLWQQRLIPKRKIEEIETNLSKLIQKRKALEAQKKGLKIALVQAQKKLSLARNQKKQIQEIKKGIDALKAREKALKAQLEHVNLLLAHCSLKSPLRGIVAKKFHVAGDVVGPGEPVLALVDPHDLYVLVLLEENKLHGVKPGCPVKIKIDAYPRKKFTGLVEEILPTTAAKFALVPRDISAGEFTKVAQRIPVKVKITQGPIEILRVGLGGEVEIERRD